MRKLALASVIVCLATMVPRAQEPEYYLKAHLDEACSCPLFCPCYFQTSPAGDRCDFNIVYNVEPGSHYGGVKLDGMKVWLSGNLGADWSQGKTDAVIAAFEPTATKEQVDAFMKIATKIYPVEWQKVEMSDRTTITTTHAAGKHTASRGDNMGQVELVLPQASANDGKTPPVIRNLKYFGAPKNAGFRLYQGTHRYKGHGYDYTLTKRNGFTIDLEVGTAPPAPKKTTAQ